MHTILPHETNPILRKTAHEIPVKDIGSKKIQQLIADMKSLLAKEEFGVALAAPQVGEPLRLFIVSTHALEKRRKKYNEVPNGAEELPTKDEVFINPVLLKMSREKKEKHEGCLSIRGKWGTVPRAEKITISFFDEHGTKHTRGASGLLAHIFQHELDHLEGILYTDKASALFDEEKKKGAKQL